jgi:hypothetical protein
MARPTSQSPEIIAKLEYAFSIGCNNKEACIFAGVPKSTFHLWCKNDPELLDRFNDLKEQPILKARQRAVEGIEESYSNAMDYLKRKRVKEFGDRNNLDLGDTPIQVIVSNAGAQKYGIDTSTDPDNTKHQEV